MFVLLAVDVLLVVSELLMDTQAECVVPTGLFVMHLHLHRLLLFLSHVVIAAVTP